MMPGAPAMHFRPIFAGGLAAMFAALAPAQSPNAAAPAIPAPSAPWAPATKPAPPGSRPPNVVLVLIDDLGYGDIGPYGGSTPTPNLDRLAKEGRRFTDFSVSSAVCSASRAAILTGCVHERVGIRGALGPDATHGLAAAEQTIAELLRARGYATACFGKWHLGHHPRFLPPNHGFDEWFGLPYSNDMWPLHPAHVDLPKETAKRKQGYPPLPLIDGTKVVDAEVDAADQRTLTRRFTERAVDFIERRRSQPFFVYLPHAMVHVPLFASDAFDGKTGKGRFGDALAEVDWSVGQLLDCLDRCGLADDTLVLFTSDNGPWLSYGEHAGSAGPLREGKGTMWEGGVRVPFVARWPGRVPAGTTCAEFAASIDLLPTLAALTDAGRPALPIDGHDIAPLLRGEPDARSPHTAHGGWYDGRLRSVRDGRFKLVLPHRYQTLAGAPGGAGGRPAPYQQQDAAQALYDLKADPGERTDVSAAHPDVVARLLAAAEALRAELGDTATGRKGTAVRPADRLAADDERLRW
jgi:arylsulfatase A-like enzyme